MKLFSTLGGILGLTILAVLNLSRESGIPLNQFNTAWDTLSSEQQGMILVIATLALIIVIMLGLLIQNNQGVQHLYKQLMTSLSRNRNEESTNGTSKL